MNLKETLTEEALDLLDAFDFERVHKVMNFLEWKWYDTEESARAVPDITQLRRTARKMILRGIDTIVSRHDPREPMQTYGVKTGGLSVMITVCNTGDSTLEDARPWCKIDLVFALHETFNDGVCYDIETTTE